MKNTEKTYRLQPFKTADLVRFTKIIGKFGVKEVRRCITSFDYGKAQRESTDVKAIIFTVATEIIAIASERLPECEKEIYSFLAHMTGKKAEEIGEQPPLETLNMIKEIVESKDFVDFFTGAFKLLVPEAKE